MRGEAHSIRSGSFKADDLIQWFWELSCPISIWNYYNLNLHLNQVLTGAKALLLPEYRPELNAINNVVVKAEVLSQKNKNKNN